MNGLILMKSDNSINQIKKIHLANDELVIDWQDGSQSNLYSHWLRDHCQMPQSRNANNGQRLFSVINIPKNTSIEEVKQDERGDLHIRFMPENYWSIFSQNWLWINCYNLNNHFDDRSEKNKHLWQKTSFKDGLPRTKYKNFQETDKRYELNKKHKFYNGINESFSIDNCTHSFFGVSKSYADLIVQEFGKNNDLKTVSFRAGCITGPNHSGAKLHGFLSYLVKNTLLKKKYSIIGYKGKQVRDNLHSHDLINCFWEFYKKPKKGEVYNIGGGRFSNCSILEALNLVERHAKIKIKRNIIKQNRTGDHIWYISNLNKFKKDYPNWKQKYNTSKIIKELITSVN